MKSVALMILCGCDVGARVAVTFPDLDQAQSLVVAVRTDEGMDVEAYERDDRPVHLLTSDSAVVEIVAYDRTLSALGLMEGTLAFDENGVRFPMPLRVYEARYQDDQLTAWVEKEAMSTQLSDFTITPPQSGCAPFTIVSQADVPFTYSSLELDGRMYIGGPSGLSRVSVAGVEHVMLEPELSVRSMAVADGSVWLSTDGGAFHRGDISFTPPLLEHVFTATSGESLSWIDAGPEEVYGLSNRGVVERFDGTKSRVIHRFPRLHTLGAGLARVRDGEMVAVHQLIGSVVRYRDGEIFEEPIETAELIYFNTVAQVPGVGTVIGSEQGRFFVDDGDGWTELGDSMFSLRVLSIEPTEHGFLWGGEFGVLGEYRRDSGFCAPETIHGNDVWHVREIDGLVYILNRGDAGIAGLTILRR